MAISTYTFLVRSSWTDPGDSGTPGSANHKGASGAGNRRKKAIKFAEDTYDSTALPPNNLKVRVAQFTFDDKYDFAWQVDLNGASSADCVQTLAALWSHFSSFGYVKFNWGGGAGGAAYAPPASGQYEPDIRDIT
jgi:hypothetical protein